MVKDPLGDLLSLALSPRKTNTNTRIDPKEKNMTNKTVSFHDTPPDQEKTDQYKEALRKAKLGQRSKPGNLENTPRFDQAGTWKEGPSDGNFLSPDTKQGLAAMARAAKSGETVTEPEVLPEDPVDEDEEELTQDEKIRKAVESRIEDIDIGEYLMSGVLLQEVPIIPGKLSVEFKTVTDLEESYVDTIISEDPNLTNRQFLRKMNELALAIHINTVNGNKWPVLLDGDGTVSSAAADARLRQIRKLSSPVFNMMTQNLSWFMDRVSAALTAGALGNG
jgi:hypothetical protein